MTFSSTVGRNRKLRCSACSSIVAALLIWNSIAGDTAAQVRPATVIAVTGQQVPGAPAGTYFDTFAKSIITNGVSTSNTAILNDNGDVTFNAALAGPMVIGATDQAVFSTAGGLHVVARRGDLPAGASGAVAFNSFAFPSISQTGEVAFAATLAGVDITSANANGVWIERNGQLQLVARSGDQVPAIDPGIVFSSVNNPLVGLNGAVAFIGSIKVAGSTGAFSGVFVDRGAGLQPEFLQGQQLNETPPGVTLSSFVNLQMAGNTALAFTATLAGTGVTILNDVAMFTETPAGVVTMQVREGQHAPGINPGSNFAVFGPTSPFSDPLSKGTGEFVFRAQANGGSGVWDTFGGSVELSLRAGVDVPGLPGVRLSTVGVIGMHNGDLTFGGTVSGLGSYDDAILTRTDGVFSVLAKSGDAAADLPGFIYQEIFPEMVNSRGQTLFESVVRGPDGSRNRAVFAQDGSGQIHLLVRVGEQIEVAPGDLRTIRTVVGMYASTNDDGRRSSFNNNGYFGYQATFTDGSQALLISDVVAVPEPAGIALATLGAVVLLAHCWRRAFAASEETAGHASQGML